MSFNVCQTMSVPLLLYLISHLISSAKLLVGMQVNINLFSVCCDFELLFQRHDWKSENNNPE